MNGRKILEDKRRRRLRTIIKMGASCDAQMFCNKATRTAARLLESKKSKLFDDIIDIMWDPKNAENTVQFHNKCMNCLEDVGNKDKAFYKDLNDCKKDK